MNVSSRGVPNVLSDLKKVESAGGRLERVGGKLQNIGAGMSSVGSSLSMYVTAPLVAAGAASVKFAADYEQSLRNAVSVTGLQGDAARQAEAAMDDFAKQMGQETAFSAKEAADAMYDLASAGWDTKDMTEGLRGIMDLAAATQTDLAETTQTTVSTLNQFGLEAEESGRVADVFARVIGSTPATMDKLQNSMKMVGPVAASFGWTLEETTAALGQMYAAGFEGEQAGTALRGALASLATPAGQTKEALDEMGVSMEEVNPATNSLAEIMQTLEAAGMDTRLAMQLFGREAAPAMLGIAGQGVPALTELTSSLDEAGGTAQRVAQDQLDTFGGQLTILVGSLQTAAIEIGQKFTPALQKLVEFLTPLVNGFASLPAPVMAVVLAIAGLAAAIGPVLFVLGQMVMAVGSIVIAVGAAGGLSAVLAAAGAALTAVAAAAAPFLIAAAAIAAIAVVIYRNWDRIKAVFAPVARVIRDVTAALGGSRQAFASLPGPLQAVIAAAQKFGNAIRTFVLGQARVVVTWFRQNWPLIQRTATVVFSAVAAVVRTQINIVSAVIRAVVGAIVAFWRANHNQLRQIVQSVWNIIKTVVSTTIRAVLGVIKAVMQLITGDWRGAWSTIKRVLSDVWNAMRTIVREILNIIVNLIRASMNTMREIISGAWQWIRSRTQSAWDSIRDAVRQRIEATRDRVMNVVRDLRQKLSDAWDAIKRGAREAFDAFRDAIVSRVEDMRSRLVEILRAVVRIVAGVLDAFGQNELANEIRGAVSRHATEGSSGPTNRGRRGEGGAVAFARGGIYQPPVGGVADGKVPRTVYGEVGKREYYIVPERPDNVRYLAGAASEMGYGLVPRDYAARAHVGPMMARGGKLKSPLVTCSHCGGHHDESIHHMERGGTLNLRDLPRHPGWASWADHVARAATAFMRVGASDVTSYPTHEGGGNGGYSTDVWVGGSSYGRRPSDPRKFQGFADWVVGNAGGLGAAGVISNQKSNLYGGSRGWRQMEDRGSITQNHYDHVHVWMPSPGSGTVGANLGEFAAPGGGGSASMGPSLADQIWLGEGQPPGDWKEAIGKGVGDAAIRSIPVFGPIIAAARDAYPGLKKLLPEDVFKERLSALGTVAEAISNFISKYKDWVRDWIYEKFGSTGVGPGDWDGGGNLREWVEKGLRHSNAFPATEENIRKTMQLAMGESGGDPNAVQSPAVNDINMQRGDPARGLMQIIRGTWESHRALYGSDTGPYDSNWMNPVMSVSTSAKYQKAKYGYLRSTPGYSEGGMAIGPQLMALAEQGGRELVLPLDDAQVMRSAQAALGTAELREEFRELRREMAERLEREIAVLERLPARIGPEVREGVIDNLRRGPRTQRATAEGQSQVRIQRQYAGTYERRS